MAVVGRVARTHGIRGQVVVNLETDFPGERFRQGAELFVQRAGRTDVEKLTIRAVRFQQGRPVIAFDGVDDMDAAGQLAGAELRVPLDRLAVLPPDTFYHHDLVDCVVQTEAGTHVGVVKGVEGTMSGSRLVVATPDGDVLVPLAAEICRTIDPEGKRIVIAPPDGLLELNARRSS